METSEGWILNPKIFQFG